MFSWVSSFFSSNTKHTTQTQGSLIRYTVSKPPKTLSIQCQMHVGRGMNEDEYVVKVEDQQWDLDENLQFSLVSNPHHLAAFSWRDTNTPNSYLIFILADQAKVDEVINMVSFFLWRVRYGENPDKNDMTEMRQLIGESKFPFDLETLEPLESHDDKRRRTTSVKREPSPPPSSSSGSRRKTMYPTFEPEDDSRYDNETVLYSTPGDLFLLDANTNQFNQKGEDFQLSIVQLGDASRFLTLLVISARDGQRVMSTPINSTMALSILNDHNAIGFNTTKPLATWAFMFQDPEEIRAKKLMVQCVWESQYLKDFATLDADDQLYLYQSYIAGIEGDEGGYESEDYMDLEEDEDEYEEEDDDEPQLVGSAPAVGSGEKNRLLVDSAKHDRAFVVRGDQIGIFNDETAEFQGMIKVGIKPDQIMLHNNESRILLSNHGKVSALDLTKEKIVEEYRTDTNIKNIGTVQKYAEQTNQQLFAAMSNNAIWGMDPRVGGKDQSINKITYKTNPKFNVFATSAHGQLAVGSEDGIIRMYTGISGLQKMSGKGLNPKSAKTNLPGFGDEIIGIDVSGDGKWILATCEKYLMVIPTEIDGATGFEKRMGKRKPSPRRLQLLPQDVMRLEGNVKFTPAKFNTGADGETWLVTSTGNYIVTWNFRRVQKNHIHDYTLKRMHDHISAEQFVSMEMNATGANEAPIFVVLDNDVAIEKRVRRDHNPFQSAPQF